MERTESKIIQVSPNYENDKIQEQQTFRWNLQNRQEIHEEGDTEGGPGLFSGDYVVTTRVNVYVKLHFVRSLEMPNIAKIKELESAYNAIARPHYPKLVPGGFPLIVFWVLPWLTIYIPFFYMRKKRDADVIAQQIREKYREVSQQMATL